MSSIAYSEPLSSALFGKTRSALLGLLYGHPDESFYLRQIARRVRAGYGAVQRDLVALTEAGILAREQVGRHVFYHANARCPIFEELKAIAVKTSGVAEILRRALAPLRPRIERAFLYGSAARNRLRRSSDIDLCVVGDAGFGEVVTALHGVEEKIAREVNPSVFSTDEFREKLAEGHHFIAEIVSGPMLYLIGSADDLTRMGQERVVRASPTSAK